MSDEKRIEKFKGWKYLASAFPDKFKIDFTVNVGKEFKCNLSALTASGWQVIDILPAWDMKKETRFEDNRDESATSEDIHSVKV